MEANVNLSAVLIAMGRVADAEDSLRRASRSNPGNLDILQNLGESLRVQERYEEAVEVYTEIIESSPDRPLTHAALGDTPVPAATLRRSDRGPGAGAGAGAPMRPSSPRCMCLRAGPSWPPGGPARPWKPSTGRLPSTRRWPGATAGRERALQAMEQRGR